MLSKVTAVGGTVSNERTTRVTFALRPNHGSDREIAWSSLSSDIKAGRNSIYITSSVDFDALKELFPKAINHKNKFELKFKDVSVLCWPLEPPSWLIPIGYLRFFLWVITFQLYLWAKFRGSSLSVHFLTYTQLATPIILGRPFRVFLGPAGVIPKIPKSAPVSRKLKIKSWIMWQLFMPIVRTINGRKQFVGAVVHESIVRELGPNVNTRVLSALNVDYLKSSHSVTDRDKNIDVIVVARDVIFKNLEIAVASLKFASEKHGLVGLVVNAGKPADHIEVFGDFMEIGRQSRDEVMNLMKSSRLHLMLSVELGGYINLEAAQLGVPTVCLQGYGASAILRPSPKFTIKLESLCSERLGDITATLLQRTNELHAEATRQADNAKFFIQNNRDQFEAWLQETDTHNL